MGWDVVGCGSELGIGVRFFGTYSRYRCGVNMAGDRDDAIGVRTLLEFDVCVVL